MTEHTESLRVWLCPECGQRADFDKREMRYGHKHHFPERETKGWGTFVPAEEVEVIPAADFEGFKQRLTSDEAIRAVHAFLFPGTEYAGRDEYPSLLGAIEAAVEAAEQESSHGT